jgi:RNA polymerase sigma factor (sigma-70 family)
MSDNSDADLLERYTLYERDEAFTELVNRYIHLVHSVALRHTNNEHHAQEITQAVFIILARKARSLGRNTILSGWLCHTAWLTAANFRRTEWRRARNEQEAFMQTTLGEAAPHGTWQDLVPFLDETLAQLGQRDRDAIVLRYFQNKSLLEVASVLGVGERAAQKRVSRALEKMRCGFAKRGVAWSAAMLASAISTKSVQATSASLARTISATALKGSAGAGSTLTLVKETLQIMNWMRIKIAGAIVGTSLLVAGAAVAYTHRNNSLEVPSQAQALQDKRLAERNGVAPTGQLDPSGRNKLEDEQKALRESQAQALQDKRLAERNGVAPTGRLDPSGRNKLEDEQNALREKQNQAGAQ